MHMLKLFVFALALAVPGAAVAQSDAAKAPTSSPAPLPVPADYVIGPNDVLHLVFWKDKDMTTEAVVRPDGKISVPLLNDVQAAGLTPAALREQLTDASRKYLEDPSVTVVVREINSRRVFVTGEVAKPGPYPLTAPTSVLQMLAMAGGLREFADAKNILVMRTVNGQPTSFTFNYRDVSRRKNLQQNIELKPGDTIIVP
jgi:polysaccharide export outer membrane protein